MPLLSKPIPVTWVRSVRTWKGDGVVRVKCTLIATDGFWGTIVLPARFLIDGKKEKAVLLSDLRLRTE